jgi:CRISPR system Cascade subunit CasE
MYLARGVLNPASRDVQRDLADPVHLHRTLMKLFPDGVGDSPRKALGVLHRVDEDRRRGQIVLFVQSIERPDLSALPPGYFAAASDDLDLALSGEDGRPRIRSVAEERQGIADGDRFIFRLRANTTKKILTKSLADGAKQNGKRVPVRGDEARLGWLTRHAGVGGFRLHDVRIAELPATSGRGKHARVTLAGCLFEGSLVVTDAAAFRSALSRGVGPGKAFGFGLLSVLRASEPGAGR